ncbi:hypothetical protein BWI15_26770 [Kribbella sp. ALI-6-A]|uniref:MOSC domain-containing protein n=1 Tax=Kribbella sp. ALI-6-A TaxID=1933817 RepID=UPI00097CB3CC|nr:MOSC N-terminal beta barrel domain-containing protein [Kribbella sp. ALI-6-A]ONI66803.1 hypothetical protein BWI15_26770 [Kribbella sp. ALI-6-A]
MTTHSEVLDLGSSVLSAGFAPVKGTRHLSYPEVRFDRAGPVGDRQYCLVDLAAGRVLKTVENSTLIAVVSTLTDAGLEITLPTGETVCAPPEPTGEVVASNYWGRTVDLELTRGPHAALLSDWLDRDVHLARAPRGAVVFNAPVSIVTTASLRDLGARADHPDLAAEAARFRATLMIDTITPYAEEAWLGHVVRGGDVLLRVGAPIPRCAVIDFDPTHGIRRGRLLKTLARYRPTNAAGEPCFGVSADVIGPADAGPSHGPTISFEEG